MTKMIIELDEGDLMDLLSTLTEIKDSLARVEGLLKDIKEKINLDDIEKQNGIALVVNEKNMHSVQDIFNPTDVNDKQMEFDFDYK